MHFVEGVVNVLQNHIVDAVTLPGKRRNDSARAVERVCNLETATQMAKFAVADGHVRDLTDGADVPVLRHLVLWSQNNREALLRESTPRVFGDVAVEQYPLRILQLEVVLHDEGIAMVAQDDIRLARHPGQRLEEMVVADLNIGRSERRVPASEQDIFRR